LAERYGKHPALKMWHISNEYGGECHCSLCQAAFRGWLRERYDNDLDLLNEKWWNTFWSHKVTDWEQIGSPKPTGENGVSAHMLCWRRFVSDSHISFFEDEIVPIRELTPDIPVTANLMRLNDGIDYQKFAKHLDIVSWDNYPDWELRDDYDVAAETAFVHDSFRSMKKDRPFYMMESSPSNVNWFDVNKIPHPGISELTAVQAVAHGSDSVQYFQWRKGRGGSEKYHGAVIDHCGHENTRVFREAAHTGAVLEKLSKAAGTVHKSSVAVICDWENKWATDLYQGFNNIHRDYFEECIRYYRPLWKRGIAADVIPMDADFSGYSLIIAPYLYMLKDGTEERIRDYVANGGIFVSTYLTGMTDSDDRCYMGGTPCGSLMDVFGIWREETDALPDERPGKAFFGTKEYSVDKICDIIHAETAEVLGRYGSDFYEGMPCVTKNTYGRGSAYTAAFRNDGDLADDLVGMILKDHGLAPKTDIAAEDGLTVRWRGRFCFIMNFTGHKLSAKLENEYTDVIAGEKIKGAKEIGPYGYIILEQKG
ncbi:MAG: beta-galactosidase, partial [Lachnospiraceae bacterium]|nr:beta-galactosidase [Lachnospiraceae bacterium]